jgi:hypothetical protein
MYRLIEPTYPQCYVFVDLDGQGRCIDTRSFEKVEREEHLGSRLERGSSGEWRPPVT